MQNQDFARTMAISFLFVGGVSGVSYTCLLLIGVDRQIALIVACTILGTLVPVYRYLRDKQLRASFLKGEATAVDFRRSALKWYLIVIYGSLVLTAGFHLLQGMFGFEIGLLLGALKSNPQLLSVQLSETDYTTIVNIQMFGTVLLTFLLIEPVCFFLLGRWIGKKGSHRGLLALFLTIGMFPIINLVFIGFIPDIMFGRLQQMKGESIRQAIVFGIASLIVGIPFALLGYWRGRRKVLMSYLQDVFRILPRERQKSVLIALAKECGWVDTDQSRSELAPTESLNPVPPVPTPAKVSS